MDNIRKHFSAAALCAAFLFFAAFASFGQNVIYQCDFEDNAENANWTLANGDQTNQWYIGTAANNGGSNGLYITNDGGASNAYDNTSTSYVYAYREINVTENAWYNFELDWRGYGQYYYDIMNMFLIPTSVNPDLSAGNPNGMEYSPYSTPSGWIGATGVLYGYSEWTHVFIEQEIEAGTYYLVLFWKNNNSYGENPAAAIDNISIAKNNCVSISNVWVEDVEAESATIVWEERGTATSWEIIVSTEYLEDAQLETADNIITATDMYYSLTGLEPLTYYYIYVRAACSNDEHSLWKSTSFETHRIPATLPYSFGFEDDTENANWELSDEAANVWVIGTAASNSGEKGLFISNNDGISSTYNNQRESYAYAARRISMTEDSEYQFDFDWRANGSTNGYDLLRAFVIPTYLDPSISYGYHNDMYSNYNEEPSGWIDASDIGQMYGQSNWQHSTKVLTLDAGTYYFVFFWKNSESREGDNPPAAIDNVNIIKVINPAVATSSVSDIFSTSATVYGTLLSQGVSDVTERGFEYGTDRENLSGNIQSADNTDDFSSVVTGLAPNTVYYYRAYATNSEGTGYGAIRSFQTNGNFADHEFVDLGLPSKTYWATLNLGATNPEDMGSKYAWGETTPKDTYEWSTYRYCNGSENTITKYCSDPDFGDNGFTDDLTALEPEDDAATANWGSYWRMPLADEMIELYTYCSHVWTTRNGVTGRLFTGPNGNAIFLPGTSNNSMSDHYWTNELYLDYPRDATTLNFGSGTRATLNTQSRYRGLPVRAVYRLAPYLATVSQSNVTLSSATLSGLIYDNGISDIIERGFQYGTDPDNLTETIQSELGENEFTASLTGLAPNTTYYYRAYATNSGDTGYGEIKSFRTPSGQLGDHYYVNLGLPSGTMWATCNVGGTNFEDLGNEYAWGETTTKDEYTQNNYTYSDNPATLPADADAAAVNWGEDWIMPTQADMQELLDYCDTVWTKINGTVGLMFTSGNGNSIFIPTEIYEGYSTSANYWSSSLYIDNPASAMQMNLYSGDSESQSWFSISNNDRAYSARVRPVYKVAPTAFELGDEPYSCDFENADENAQWVLANGRQPSKWYIGTAASNGGANGLYISADDGAHNSYNFAEPSSTYAYRLINITNADLYQVDFDWRATGDDDYDFLMAFLIPASIFPELAPGAEYDPDWITISREEIMSDKTDWQHSKNAVNIEETGIYYLTFLWSNDNYNGNNPPAAIDNISISKATSFFIDDRDNNIYSFVTIGDQTWLAENLRFEGNIPLGTGISDTEPYLYYPDGDEYFVSTCGYLYNWPAAMNGENSSSANPSGVQGICPDGWHLPSEDEWTQLFTYLGGTQNAGAMLAGNEDFWYSGDLTQSQYFGNTEFYALPAGNYAGSAQNFGSIARFWTTTELSNSAYYKEIRNNYTDVYSDAQGKDFGNSVRCVKNADDIASNPTGYHNNHGYVNLGLPSGTMWATCNVGATNPEDFGNYYGWGETTPKETYNWSTYRYCNGSYSTLTKYCNNSSYGNNGFTDNLTTLEAFDDAATANWGIGWRMPTFDEMEELYNNCDTTWTTQNGIKGMLFTSRNNVNSIFLPAAGDYSESQLHNTGLAGLYLSSSLVQIDPHQAWHLDLGSAYCNMLGHVRYDGLSVRAIYQPTPTVATYSADNITLTSATLHGNISYIGASEIIERGFEYGTDRENLTETVQCTDGTNEFSVSLSNLALGTTYYYRAYATNSDETGYGEIETFTTKICLNEDMCEISYSLSDDYGDGWTGNAINVVDAGTGTIIESLTFDYGSVATGTVEICNGREIIFEWVEGSYPEETIYQIFDVNGDEIFSGAGTISSPVSYTMSCSSCRVVADFTVTNITEESATISFTEQGQATSWELIVSETELDDNALDVSDSTVILTDTLYFATGLTRGTQYYVYVRSVCSDDEKSSWKKRAFVTRFCPSENMCGISYELAADEGYGWSGGSITIVDVESEIVIATLTLNQGSSATGTIDVCDGREISINYVAGQFPDDVSYHIFDANGDVIDSYYGLDAPTTHSRLYTVSCPTCKPVKNIRATEIATESATIRWADYGTAENWELVVSEEELDDDALENNGTAVQVTDSSYTLTGLGRSRYYVYVRALCSESEKSKWRNCSFKTRQIPATLPYTCDFEDATENGNWTFANEDQTNQWHIGEAANNGGDNGLYISSDGGTSNEYDINSPSVVYAYRTIDVDEDAIYEVSFDWRSNGDGNYYSAVLGVFLVPVSSDFDMVGGNELYNFSDDWIIITDNPLAGETSWQNFRKITNIDAGSYNLIFYWSNRNSGNGGTNPPAAIDNISIIKRLPPDISVKYPMERSTTGASIQIQYSELTDDEDYTLYLYYGTNRNDISDGVSADYNSTSQYDYAELTGLEPDTKYYYYAEAISEFGTFRSDTLSFYTWGEMIDDRDNHRYYTIRIGNQVWMAEDLAHAGNIPEGTIGETSSTEPYRYPTSYCTEYSSYLYNWQAAMNGATSSNDNPSGVQGICPNGWHLPSEAEWQELYDTLGGNDRDAGAQLAMWLYSDTNPIAESEYIGASGFDVIYSNWYSGSYNGNYENATFWSATESNGNEAYYHRIYKGTTDLLSGSSEKGYGFNVRCLKGTAYYVHDTIGQCGYEYAYHDTIITASGDYKVIKHLSEDTDSIYVLHLTLNQPATLEYASGDEIFCSGDDANIVFTYGGAADGASVTGLPSGMMFDVNTSDSTVVIYGTPTNPGAYSYTVTTTGAVSPCTNISVSRTITVNAPATITLASGASTQTICNGDAIADIVFRYEDEATGAEISSLPAGLSQNLNSVDQTLTISGTPLELGTFNFVVSTTGAIAPCTDNEIAVSITVNPSVTFEFEQTACNSFEWNGETYTESGNYEKTLQTVNGCDSIVTMHLTINHSSTGEFADLMCAGVPYTYGGETFTEAGTYTVTLTNSVGCDSVVTLTLTYADNCNGIISGIITDDYTGDLIPNARVTIGNNVTYTNAEGQYSLEVLRGRKTLRVSAVEYISHSEIIDIQGDTTINIALNSPRIITSDNISLTTYPYLEQTDTITITNTGNGTLVWSSITEYDGLALVEDSTIQRRNSRSLWDSIQTFATRENAEQAVATDGFFIYTSSWMRPGEFNRYTPSGEYVETFFIENVGMIRNLSYNGNYFYGTDATNVIYKLDLDNQTLLGSIETDIPEIRHCSFNRLDGSILAGDWNSLYRIDTTSGTSQQIRSDLANVYSSAFDNLSAGGPYLWLFSQTSQDNGPSACIRQFDISANDFTDKIHYLDDIEISDASLAGGICASEYVCEGKFVLLANVQNPSGSNTIATYEIGRTNSVARAERKSGSIAPSESESIPVRASATETGEYASTIRYRAAVMGRQSNDVIVNISAIAPECDAVQRIIATTDNSTITLEWSPVELGEYESVSYLVYNTSSQYAIDTLSDTSVTYRGLPLGEHCFYVRALSSAGYTCLSEASDTVCAEIKNSPCDIPLFVEARSDGETITVSWNTHADVDYFNIYKDGESIAENLTTTTFVDTDVVSETDYCYTVVAHLGSGSCNEISGETCMRILTGVCTEVPTLIADALGNLVVLKWTECDGAVNYRIFRDNEFVGTTTDISYTDNVHDAGNYCYVVESDCEHGMYKLSNEECVFADAIAEWSADNITLYPNPTYSQFFIEGQHIATVQIFNAIGQLVAEIENSESERITINCNDWNPGLYNVLLISTEGEMATRKVTIFR